MEIQNKYIKYAQFPFCLVYNVLRMIPLTITLITWEQALHIYFGSFIFQKSSCLPPGMRSQYILMHNAFRPSAVDIPKSESQDPIRFIYHGCFNQMISVRMQLLMMMER